uniref:Zgc:171482 n=1 Tax=Cyprinus carpio TaxID=7962 RepID=A0A8C1TWW8_CYPCA
MKSAGAGDEGLFTESYCNICNAQLISESQRVAHYEVSAWVIKLKQLNPDNFHAETEVDRNKCCTLCNMFFTSAIVAQSHYQGKTHAKRVRLVLGETPSLPASTGKRHSTQCILVSSERPTTLQGYTDARHQETYCKIAL